jgi:hypothetical protein
MESKNIMVTHFTIHNYCSKYHFTFEEIPIACGVGGIFIFLLEPLVIITNKW